MKMTIYFLHTFCAEIALSYHLHLYLCAFHTVSLAYHRTEDPVAREVGIACNEQVAEICRVINITIYWSYRFKEA